LRQTHSKIDQGLTSPITVRLIELPPSRRPQMTQWQQKFTSVIRIVLRLSVLLYFVNLF